MHEQRDNFAVQVVDTSVAEELHELAHARFMLELDSEAFASLRPLDQRTAHHRSRYS